MTATEMSDAFSTLLNSYSEKAVFGDNSSRRDIILDEYEKSLFLTMAQKDIVVMLYTGRMIPGLSFESTEEARRYLDVLMQETTLGGGEAGAVTSFTLPTNVAYIVYEDVTINEADACDNGSIVIVQPVTHDEYDKLRHNPFRGATRRRVLRLDVGNKRVELYSTFAFTNYRVRYLEQPSPIITDNISAGGTSIDGKSAKADCELNPLLHNSILNRAVQLALAAKGIQITNNK